MKLAAAALTVVAVSASSIPANSKTGRSIMSKARRLDQNNNGDMTWAANYSIKFEKCATSKDYYGGYFGGNNQNQNGNAAAYNGMYEQRLVHFKLCPSDTCGSSCSNGADYVVDMNEFVGAYLEQKAEAQEKACETAKQSCEYNCQNANDDEMCQNQCLSELGLTECMDDDQNQNQNGQQGDDFDLEQAMECRKLEFDDEAAQYYAYQNNMNNGNWNNQQNGQQQMEFFVGPYCSSNGKSILLGVFMDEVCGFEAPSGVYEKFNYGRSLPYSSESLISNECISCKQVNEDENQNQDNENGNNDNQQEEEVEVKEMCKQLYEPAAKCEQGLTNVYGLYPNTMGCQFIQGLKVSGKARIMATFSNMSEAAKNNTPGLLAGLFALTTLIFGGVAYHFHGKANKQNVGLVSGSGGDMA